MQQHFHASHKGVALNPSVYAQPWAVWPCGGGTRPGEARNWGADQPRSTCVERTYDWTHMQTRKHTRTYAYTHTSPFPASSSFPAPPVVLVTACRACHCHVCSAAMLPCLLSVRAAVVLRGPRSVEMPAVAASSMTQIDGWTRGAVKARKGWPITPFRGSGNGNWLIFGSFSLN